MDLVAGTAEAPSSVAQLWSWLRDPLIPVGEHPVATQVRTELAIPETQTSTSPAALDQLTGPLRRRLETAGPDLLRNHNPFVRHVIKRRRRDLRNPDGTPVFPEMVVHLHGEGDDDALEMSDRMADAYADARAYCEAIAKVRPGAGILKTLLPHRIGSSLRSGLLTARKLRVGEAHGLLGEEEEAGGTLADLGSGGDALKRLDDAIQHMEAAGDDDPKLQVVLRYLRQDGWAERGCIMFSQYADTVLWLASHLAVAFASTAVAVYGGQGNSLIFESGSRRGATREEIQDRVRDRSLRIVVATDAASEGLNLQRLETLINIDLPWNPARLEQRKGRIDRIGQLAKAIDILNLRYRGSVEDEVHRALSTRLQSILEVFGTLPDTLEDVWVDIALGERALARARIDSIPTRHPFDVRYSQDLPASAWERCTQVLDRLDFQRVLRGAWT